MKKVVLIMQLIGLVMLYSASSSVFADDDDDDGWHRHHHHHYPYYREVDRYYPQPRPYYREVVKYYPQPRYYAPPPQYQNYRDPRSTQGLAGGVIGSVFGYQVGSGNPLATGLGAAAGSYLGNGMAGRRW